MKFLALILESIGLALPAPLFNPGKPHVRRHVEDERQIGLELAHGDAFKAFDELQVHLAEDALIDKRRVAEAVAHHPSAARTRPDLARSVGYGTSREGTSHERQP